MVESHKDEEEPNRDLTWYKGSTQPNFLFTEFCAQQNARIRRNSPFGMLKSWRLARIIVKSGDDLRLE